MIGLAIFVVPALVRVVADAQQSTTPQIGFLSVVGSPAMKNPQLSAFRHGRIQSSLARGRLLRMPLAGCTTFL